MTYCSVQNIFDLANREWPSRNGGTIELRCSTARGLGWDVTERFDPARMPPRDTFPMPNPYVHRGIDVLDACRLFNDLAITTSENA